MDPVDLHAFPRTSISSFEHDLAEVDAAIALVDRHIAERVRLVGLTAAESVVAVALARAQAAGVELSVDRSGPSLAITIGPTCRKT